MHHSKEIERIEDEGVTYDHELNRSKGIECKIKKMQMGTQRLCKIKQGKWIHWKKFWDLGRKIKKENY